MLCGGIDAGSRAIKIVLLEAETGEIVASGVRDQGVPQEAPALHLFEQVLQQARLERPDIGRIVATGYARNLIPLADTTVTEITCHARGVHHLLPETALVIEIGGQDSKLLRLQTGGLVRDFAMNDRCAAGTGRFLEVVADRLNVRLEELGEMAAQSRQPAPISSMCVVFAETEIIGLLASGAQPEDIVAGVQHAIATRVSAMAAGKVTPPVVFTGGVALVPGMAGALEAALGQPVQVAPNPQFTGALGAALIAGKQLKG
jgi:(R)-2-hydroxyacyl-CoA dehydratese activating ATPase